MNDTSMLIDDEVATKEIHCPPSPLSLPSRSPRDPLEPATTLETAMSSKEDANELDMDVEIVGDSQEVDGMEGQNISTDLNAWRPLKRSGSTPNAEDNGKRLRHTDPSSVSPGLQPKDPFAATNHVRPQHHPMASAKALGKRPAREKLRSRSSSSSSSESSDMSDSDEIQRALVDNGSVRAVVNGHKGATPVTTTHTLVVEDTTRHGPNFNSRPVPVPPPLPQGLVPHWLAFMDRVQPSPSAKPTTSSPEPRRRSSVSTPRSPSKLVPMPRSRRRIAADSEDEREEAERRLAVQRPPSPSESASSHTSSDGESRSPCEDFWSDFELDLAPSDIPHLRSEDWYYSKKGVPKYEKAAHPSRARTADLSQEREGMKGGCKLAGWEMETQTVPEAWRHSQDVPKEEPDPRTLPTTIGFAALKKRILSSGMNR